MNQSAARILDVNLNRAREALRVIEDYARFALDDRDAAAAAKSCRHELSGIRAALGGDALLAARDIVGDVGRDTKSDGELARRDEEEVVRAAFGRLTEATRSLGEFGKLHAAQAAAAAERLRYRAYELEQRIVLRGRLRQRFREVRLYVLLTESLCRRPWRDTLAACVRGGAQCVQLREKSLPDGELLRRARELRDRTRERGVLLAINDRPDIARLVGADIVHVGQDDLSVADVRRIAGGHILVGKSTHTVAQFRAALAEDPDYLAVGPMYDSPTKPQPLVAGAATLQAVRPLTDLPLVAIGGLTPANLEPVVLAGADVLAVCGGVIGADDPEGAARQYIASTEAVSAAAPSRSPGCAGAGEG